MKEKKGLKPDCKECDKPSLLVSNNLAVNIYYMYRNGIVGDSISLLAIDKVMEYEAVPVEDRPLLVRKIILYTTLLVNKSFERAKHG